MFCPKCGSKLDENIAFCPTCGQAMNVQAQQPAQPAQAAPVTFKRPKKCPHCNRIYETPKMSTTNIVLIVAGVVGLCAFLPLGILLLVLGGTLGRNKIPCPHCGCTPQEAKAKAKIETAQKKLTKAYKPESYTALYKTLDIIDEKFKLGTILHSLTVLFAGLLILPLLQKVEIKYITPIGKVKKELAYADAVLNADEFLGIVLLLAWLAALCFSIVAIIRRDLLWPKIFVIAVGGVNLLVNFIITEDMILDQLRSKLVRDALTRDLIEKQSVSIAGPKTILILLQILVIALLVASILVQRSKILGMIVRNNQNESK